MTTGQRFDRIDALRGVAIVWMTLFHFCFDLNHFGLIRQDFRQDIFWTGQRTVIVTLFLFCAGLGQAVAYQHGLSWPRFWRRWWQVAVCAVGVSAGSYLMFPKSWIYFGVLHGIAAMLIVARLTAGWGLWLWPLGALAIAMKYIAASAYTAGGMPLFFNEPGWNALGLIANKPRTEDYVPVLPWLGVMLWGMAAGQWLQTHQPAWVQAAIPAAANPLAWLGRHSLAWYMLHQPVLIGALMAVLWVSRQ
jgi:uncharacterized membrane protein